MARTPWQDSFICQSKPLARSALRRLAAAWVLLRDTSISVAPGCSRMGACPATASALQQQPLPLSPLPLSISEIEMTVLRRLFRCTTATAAVETAIFAPIFLTLMLGVTD